MKVICSIKDIERQGWALAFQHQGHEFSFFDQHVSIHNACQLFRPDIFIHQDDMTNRSIQNACNKYGVMMLHVKHYNLPICANSYSYQRQNQDSQENFIAVFAEKPTQSGIELVNKLKWQHDLRIFSTTRWPFNEYCGFLNPEQFAIICSTAKACVVASEVPHALHYNACLCGANLLTMNDMEIGIAIKDDLTKILDPRNLFLKQMMDYTFVKQYRDCRIIPKLIEEIYEQEKCGHSAGQN